MFFSLCFRVFFVTPTRKFLSGGGPNFSSRNLSGWANTRAGNCDWKQQIKKEKKLRTNLTSAPSSLTPPSISLIHPLSFSINYCLSLLYANTILTKEWIFYQLSSGNIQFRKLHITIGRRRDIILNYYFFLSRSDFLKLK